MSGRAEIHLCLVFDCYQLIESIIPQSTKGER